MARAPRARYAHPIEAPSSYFEPNPIERKTKKRAAEEAAFNRAVVRHLRSRYHARPPEDPWRGFVVRTVAGPLEIKPLGTWIAMRFENPERAREELSSETRYGGLNPYSGKWNIHLSKPDIETNLRTLDRMLARARVDTSCDRRLASDRSRARHRRDYR